MLTAPGLVQMRFLLLSPYFLLESPPQVRPSKRGGANPSSRRQGTPKLCLRVPPPHSVKSRTLCRGQGLGGPYHWGGTVIPDLETIYIYMCVCTSCKFRLNRGTPHGMGLTMEGRGQTLVVRVCVDIAHGMYLSVIRPRVKNAPFQRGRDDHGGACLVLPMVCILRESSWYVPCVCVV